MRMILNKLGVVLISASMLVGCKAVQNANNTQKGAGIGAVGGAVLGGILGNNIGKGGNSELGAVLGGVVGGVAGGIIGRKMDKQAERIEEEIPGAVVERVGESINVIFDEESGIYFDTSKSNINAKSEQTLQRLQKILADYADTNISISGHTDSSGAEAYNLQLSKNRAESVAAYLKTHGLDPLRFSVQWYGETKPKYDNSTAEGRSKNRRVELGIVANEKMQKEAIEEAKKQ
ncbi:OmpA family protein [Aquimarina agarilytica]|uniref:OmpA family protein n=1 Tax=Aquimarina agarilytica TaxID=1087449 RepID=UPI0002E8988E|nr:OmpA family protein [Aquimarina agarilytica]